MVDLLFEEKGLLQRLTAITEDRPPNLLPEMRDIAQRLHASILRNFREGGKPKWKPTKAGNPPLIGKGRLMGSVAISEVTPESARVSAGEGLPYAFIHQFGGTTRPRVTERSRGFFWHKFFETREEMWKFMAISKKRRFTVPIPQRKYMMFQPDDVRYIRDKITRAVFGGKR
jgi:phage gpG-like protein